VPKDAEAKERVAEVGQPHSVVAFGAAVKCDGLAGQGDGASAYVYAQTSGDGAALDEPCEFVTC
jgi:hypothetical protein